MDLLATEALRPDPFVAQRPFTFQEQRSQLSTKIWLLRVQALSDEHHQKKETMKG